MEADRHLAEVEDNLRHELFQWFARFLGKDAARDFLAASRLNAEPSPEIMDGWGFAVRIPEAFQAYADRNHLHPDHLGQRRRRIACLEALKALVDAEFF